MTLRVTFLGTSGAVPTTERNPSGVFINRDGDRLLFDCGEGTQRQMMRYGTGFGLAAVFLTHLHGDHVFGLPGLLQTLAFNGREDLLSIHVPPHARSDLAALITASGGEPDYPVRIHEVEPGEVAWRGDGYEVRAFETDHRVRSVGYALVEDDRKGRFDRERAVELGVPVGPAFSRLHEGESVELEDGTVVRPEQVVGPPRPGRRVVYTGDTRPTKAAVETASGADLLIHDATFTEQFRDRAIETAHSTARDAAQVATEAGVARLVLTHISSRFSGDATPLAEEGSAAFDGEVTVACDGLEIEVSYPD